MDTSNETQERIIQAALRLFYAQGIRKTAMAEVAEQAGVTRMTAYRHFGDKKELVRAAFLRLLAAFRQARADIAVAEEIEISACLDGIGQGLAALPQGDLPARLLELQRLYPDIASEFHQTRLQIVKEIFDHLFQRAAEQGLLREGIRQDIIQVVFMETVIHALQSPQLATLNVSSSQIYSTIRNVFLYGILKEPAA